MGLWVVEVALGLWVVDAAIAGNARRRPSTVNAPMMDAIATFFVFIFVRTSRELAEYLAGRKVPSGLSVLMNVPKG